MYLLDTNLVSELRKIRQGKADPGLRAGQRESPALIYISP